MYIGAEDEEIMEYATQRLLRGEIPPQDPKRRTIITQLDKMQLPDEALAHLSDTDKEAHRVIHKYFIVHKIVAMAYQKFKPAYQIMIEAEVVIYGKWREDFEMFLSKELYC